MFSACGGDGTAAWILSVMDKMTFPKGRPPLGIIPLGTGNDLSRSFNWGGKYEDKPLYKICIAIAKAAVVDLDRWSLKVDVESNDESEESDAADTLVTWNCI